MEREIDKAKRKKIRGRGGVGREREMRDTLEKTKIYHGIAGNSPKESRF